MSNLDMFKQANLTRVLEPFLPGVTEHITPIKYQAITPDIFALLFQTSGQGGNYYFVSLEFDYLRDLGEAEHIVHQWTGSKVREFLPPAQYKHEPKSEKSESLEHLRVVSKEPYYTVLALVERPTNLGYWSECVILSPGDNLKEKLVGFSDSNLKTVQKFIESHSEPQAIVPESNTTRFKISVYKSPFGGIELFFN